MHAAQRASDDGAIPRGAPGGHAAARWLPLVLAVLACGAAAQAVAPADSRPGGVLPTPAQLAPRVPTTTDPRELPPRPDPPRELAKPADELTLDVRGYQLSDNAPPALVAALPALLAPYVGPKRRYEDLVNAAADVTRWLQREAGYYLGYAYLPEQQPGDGLVRIQVLEGRLDRIDLSGWSDQLPVPRAVVEAYLARLQPGEILRVEDVERVVFLLNDLRGLSVRFDVEQGARPGTASLRVTGRADPRWSGKADLDANGSRFLGRARLGGLLAGNSLLGRGDALTLNLLGSGSGGLGFALLGYNLPVGHDGLKLGTSLSYVRYRLTDERFRDGDYHGDATAASAYALYPWRRSRNLNLFVVATLDHKAQTDAQVGESVRRRITSLTLGLTGDLRDNLLGGAVSTFEAHLSGGEVRYDGLARSAVDDAPRFTRLSLAMNRLQNLVDGRLLLYAALRAQQAMDNLDSAEQFRVGGPDGVRAFAPGEGTGDSGLVATAELRLLPPEAWLGRLAREFVLSAFVDHGEVRFRHDASRQSARFVNRAHYTGAGLALAWERPGAYALRASLATRLAGQARSEADQGRLRVYAQFTRFF